MPGVRRDVLGELGGGEMKKRIVIKLGGSNYSVAPCRICGGTPRIGGKDGHGVYIKCDPFAIQEILHCIEIRDMTVKRAVKDWNFVNGQTANGTPFKTKNGITK